MYQENLINKNDIYKNSTSSQLALLYKSKYLKYKSKYLDLKNKIEGGSKIFLREEGLDLEEGEQRPTFSERRIRPMLDEKGLEEESRVSKFIFPLGSEIDMQNTEVINNTQDTLLNNINQQFKLTNDKVSLLSEKLNDITRMRGGGTKKVGNFTQEDIDFITESNKKDHMNMINNINANIEINFKNLNENLKNLDEQISDLTMCRK